MLEELESRLDGHLGCIVVAKRWTDMLNADVRPVHSASYQPGTDARKFATAEIARVMTKKASEPESTAWAALIVFTPKKDTSFRF